MGTYFDVGDVLDYFSPTKFYKCRHLWLSPCDSSHNRDLNTFLGKSLKNVIAVGLLDVFVRCRIKFKKLQVRSPEKLIRILVS